MRIIPSFLAFVLFVTSCAPNIFKAGDRYRRKGLSENAVLEYKKALNTKGIGEDQKARLELRIAQAYYGSGKRAEALQTISGMHDIPKGIVCSYATLYLRILNDLGIYEKDRRTIDLIEDFENFSCDDQKEIDGFYNGLRRVYYPLSRDCDSLMIKGNLKRDTGDIFAALNYYKKAIKCDPLEEDFLLSALDALGKAAKTIEVDFTREKRSFFTNDYPSFFALISELYLKGDKKDLLARAKVKQAFIGLTKNFGSGRAALPVSVYSSVYFQDQGTIVGTLGINERLKFLRIDDERNLYIIFAPDKMLVGISGKINSDYFIPD